MDSLGDFQHFADDAKPAALPVRDYRMNCEQVLRRAYWMALDAVNGASD